MQKIPKKLKQKKQNKRAFVYLLHMKLSMLTKPPTPLPNISICKKNWGGGVGGWNDTDIQLKFRLGKEINYLASQFFLAHCLHVEAH